jgi:hypothetical protein
MDHDRQDASTPGDALRNRHHAGCHVAVERAADRYTLVGDGPSQADVWGIAPSVHERSVKARPG